MIRRLSLGLLWVGFIVYAFVWAPPAQPDTLDLIRRLSIGAWDDINPAIIALFNIMGIWPVIYACMALIDGHEQKVPAWPFVLGSFGLGAFLLAPYLILREPGTRFTGSKSKLLKLLDSRWTGAALAIGSFVLIIYGLSAGDWGQFVEQWRTSQFIHVMSLDFCLLWLLFPILLRDDMARRDLREPLIFWAVTLIPLLGAAMYLGLRPPLTNDESVAKASTV